MGLRQVLQFSGAECSDFVPGNKKPAGSEAVAFSVALQEVNIGATGSDRVVVIPPAGFGRAAGGTVTWRSAAHITNRSSSFRPSASTGRS